jgi:histidinol-phosphate aminotransferase
MYPHLAALTGARAITVPLTDDAQHDLEAMLREITAATRICLVCNPNNPTGTALPLPLIEDFAAELPRHVR